jgi:acyl carrier protein
MDIKAEIEACLGNFWEEMAIELGENPEHTSGLLGAPLDSITALEVLLEIDTLLNREIPAEAVIRKGGYDSKEQFVELLTKEVLAYVEEHPHD